MAVMNDINNTGKGTEQMLESYKISLLTLEKSISSLESFIMSLDGRIDKEVTSRDTEKYEGTFISTWKSTPIKLAMYAERINNLENQLIEKLSL